MPVSFNHGAGKLNSVSDSRFVSAQRPSHFGPISLASFILHVGFHSHSKGSAFPGWPNFAGQEIWNFVKAL